MLRCQLVSANTLVATAMATRHVRGLAQLACLGKQAILTVVAPFSAAERGNGLQQVYPGIANMGAVCRALLGCTT